MNTTINKFLLAEDKFMPGMHLRQPGSMYSACGPFTKKTKKEFKETRNVRYIYQNKLEKACFQNDIAYSAYKDLPGRTASDKVLHDKEFAIASNPQYDGYQ